MTSTDSTPHLPAEQRIDWIAAGAAIASISAVGIALGLGLPLLSVILEERGISPTMIGFNSAVAGVASLVAAPLVTPIARHIGVRTTMVLSILAAAASALGFYFFVPFWTWFPLRLVFHFSITALFILSEFWINAAAPPTRRGLILGIYATFLSLGFAAGPWIFSQIGSEGFLPFGIGAGVILASLVPLLLAWNREPLIGERQAGSFWRYLFAVPTATAAVLVFGAVESGGFALFPIFGEMARFSQADAAQLLTAIGLGNVLLQIPIGLYSDRVKDRRVLLLAFAAIGLVGSLCLPFLTENWWMMAGVLFIWGGCVAGLYTVGLAHLGAQLAGAELASANAAFIFCYAVGMLIGPQVIGSSLDLFGADGFSFALAFFFIGYVLLAGTRIARAPNPS
ncbi:MULTISPECIES: MFS transporter [unclassified Aureimonas]|uniref:MFS transporter n=1 Tax=unclassified Aureimonas TaxID=2615206 RepID=UPI0006FAF7C9|nr:MULTISPECIES: MFS transporter [unclassified Aureimonas]KQT60439.1 hypothetical protein ASG62_07260 [Aureimonas sp. Leaf427]KQT79317.1 hypothetical protein ASG54_09860 [Aureimonas sp. Leaf460]